MGQYSLLLMVATLVGGTLMMAQSNTTVIASNEKHADRQEEMLAREIARSGYNVMLSAARDYERAHPDASISEVVTAANGGEKNGWKEAGLNGGAYEAQLQVASPSSFAVVSNGIFADATHSVEERHVREQTLVVNEQSTFKATFIESQAGYCSAIYLQRMIPKNNNGHGNNIDGVDASNPGGSKTGEDSDPTVDDEKATGNAKSRYTLLEPELIFAAGKNRNGAAANYETVVEPGTRLNFVLAVDMNCSVAGRTDLALTSKLYDYYHAALSNGAGSLDEMEESKYAMIERNPASPNKWRIAFEDLIKFDDARHADIKANGYGDLNWKKRSNGKYSYGGSGWTLRGTDGYFDLIDRSDLPDFSDQVFEIQMLPTAPAV